MTASSRATALLAIPGAILVAAFFMPWIDILGLGGASGYDLATADQLPTKTMLLWLAPLAGAILAFTALADPGSSRNAGLGAGAVVVGPTLYYLGKAMLFGTSWGLWMVIAGALWLIVLAFVRKPDQMALPALLVLGGFFLPWTTNGSADFASWGLSGFDIARVPSLPFDLGLPSHKLAYLVPVCGALGLVGGLVRSEAGRMLGGAAGVLTIGWMAYFIGRSFSFFTGWGLWLTIGAGFVALLVSLRK